MEQRNKYPVVQRNLSDNLGKLPPQDLALEESILGALLIDLKAMPIVAGFLKPNHFYSEIHKEIYTAIFQLFSAGDPIDIRSVVAQLRSNGKIEVVGGAYVVADLTSKVSSAANVEYHSRIILELSIKREVITIASELISRAYDDGTDAFELKDLAQKQIEALTDEISQTKNEKTVGEISFNVVNKLQNLNAGQLTGLATGHKELDNLINGWNNGDLILLGGRPGMSKSVFAFQTLYHISHELGIPVGAFSLEMPSEQVVTRLIGGIAEIEHDKVKKGLGGLPDYELERWMNAAGELSKCNYRIDDSPALHIADIRARAKRMVQKYGVRMIVVDYAQLIRGMMGGDKLSRDQEIGVISRGLKAIAKENNIPVLAIASLSRDVEKRGGDKRPMLSDLRDSGSLESDADIVAFMYRPEVYKITTDSDGFATHGLAEFIVAKHRNGATDTVKLKFVGKYTKFVPWISEPTGFQRMPDQSQYIKQHVKQVLPSEKEPDDFGKNGDLPF
jgi:replicative DNA helicase